MELSAKVDRIFLEVSNTASSDIIICICRTVMTMRNLLACSPQLSLVLATNLISQFHSTNRAHGITLKYKNMTTCRESECLDTELNVNYTVLRHLTHHYKKLYNSCKFHGPIYTTTEVTAFQKLEKTKKHEFASLKTAKVPLFKHPYHAKYLEY